MRAENKDISDEIVATTLATVATEVGRGEGSWGAREEALLQAAVHLQQDHHALTQMSHATSFALHQVQRVAETMR